MEIWDYGNGIKQEIKKNENGEVGQEAKGGLTK